MPRPSRTLRRFITIGLLIGSAVIASAGQALALSVQNYFTANKTMASFSYQTKWVSHSIVAGTNGQTNHYASISNAGCGRSVCFNEAVVTYQFLDKNGNVVQTFTDKLTVRNFRSAHTVAASRSVWRVLILVDVVGDKGFSEASGLGHWGYLPARHAADLSLRNKYTA